MRYWLAVALALAACGSPPPPAELPPPPARTAGPLLSLAPEGASVVILARPAALMDDPATRRVVRAVFDDEQMLRYRARTGVDPRALAELVIASGDDGTVILARGLADAEFAVREAGERMAPMEASVEEPFVRRAGFIGARRADMAAIDDHTVAWIEGTPQLAAQILAMAQRPPARRPGPPPSQVELRAEIADAPFALLAPRPFDLPRDTGIGMLLAREEAATLAVRTTDTGELALQADLVGEFPADAHENFRALAESLAQTDLAAALGARDALPTLTLAVTDGHVRARARVDPAILATGLRTALLAEIRELVEGPTSGSNEPESL